MVSVRILVTEHNIAFLPQRAVKEEFITFTKNTPSKRCIGWL